MAPVIKRISYHRRRWEWNGQKREAWSYRIRVDGDEARVIRKSGFATRADAIAAASIAIRELREPRPSASGPKSLFVLMDNYISEGCSHLRAPSIDAEGYDIKAIKQALGEDISLRELTAPRALAIWESIIARRCAIISIIKLRRELGCLSRICGWGCRRGHLAANPFHGLRRPKAPETPPKALSVDEARRLLASANGELHAFVALCLYGGLRRNEALHLQWSQLDFAAGLLHIRNHEAFTSKSGKGRCITLHPQLAVSLQEQRQRHPASRWIFPSVDGEDMPRRSFREALERAYRKAGISGGRGAHRLRHSFCSFACAGGAPVVAVQAAAGHSSLSITQSYAKAAGIMASAAANFIPDLSSAPSSPPDPSTSADNPSAAIIDISSSGQLAAES